eukprot:m.185775 g.185775  ORF g.185775 m.185775 type:complete len:150 (-) comp16688_c3_seq1:255-704(-)
MSGLSISDAFELFKKGNTVSRSDVGMIVRSQGLCPTQRELDNAIRAAGISDSANLQAVQTVVSALARTKNDDIEGTIRRALKLFDSTGGDVVAISELSHILSSIGAKMSKEDIDEIFRQAEVDAFGQLGIDEFARLMMSAAGEEDNAVA